MFRISARPVCQATAVGAGKRLTGNEKGQIEAFTEAGWSQRRIAKELGREQKNCIQPSESEWNRRKRPKSSEKNWS